MPQSDKPRTADVPQYLIHRGINGKACFLADEDFRFYLQQLGGVARRHGCAVHAYALLSDRVHLLLTTARAAGPSLVIRNLAFRYTQYFNGHYRCSGLLWEKNYRACLVQPDRYLLDSQRHIETLAVRNGVVRHPAEYPWTSYRCNTFGQPSSVILSHPMYDALGGTDEERQSAYASLFRRPADDTEMTAIDEAVDYCQPLADDEFLGRIGHMLGRRSLGVAIDMGEQPRGQLSIDSGAMCS